MRLLSVDESNANIDYYKSLTIIGIFVISYIFEEKISMLSKQKTMPCLGVYHCLVSGHVVRNISLQVYNQTSDLKEQCSVKLNFRFFSTDIDSRAYYMAHNAGRTVIIYLNPSISCFPNRGIQFPEYVIRFPVKGDNFFIKRDRALW